MDEQSNSPVAPVHANAAANGPPAYLTYKQLSHLTGLSCSTLRRRVKDGTLPHCQPGGRRTRVVFPIDIVERVMKPAANALPPQTHPSQLNPRRPGPQPRWKCNTQQ